MSEQVTSSKAQQAGKDPNGEKGKIGPQERKHTEAAYRCSYSRLDKVLDDADKIYC